MKWAIGTVSERDGSTSLLVNGPRYRPPQTHEPLELLGEEDTFTVAQRNIALRDPNVIGFEIPLINLLVEHSKPLPDTYSELESSISFTYGEILACCGNETPSADKEARTTSLLKVAEESYRDSSPPWPALRKRGREIDSSGSGSEEDDAGKGRRVKVLVSKCTPTQQAHDFPKTSGTVLLRRGSRLGERHQRGDRGEGAGEETEEEVGCGAGGGGGARG